MSVYDVIIPQNKYPLRGKFFKKRIDTNDDDNVGQVFYYEEVSPYSATVGIIFGNVLGATETLTIRTGTNLEIDGKPISEYRTVRKVMQTAVIMTQDERIYRVEQVVRELVENKAVQRIPFKRVTGQTYLLRLVPSIIGQEERIF